jgi:hypothetical protein
MAMAEEEDLDLDDPFADPFGEGAGISGVGGDVAAATRGRAASAAN